MAQNLAAERLRERGLRVGWRIEEQCCARQSTPGLEYDPEERLDALDRWQLVEHARGDQEFAGTHLVVLDTNRESPILAPLRTRDLARLENDIAVASEVPVCPTPEVIGCNAIAGEKAVHALARPRHAARPARHPIGQPFLKAEVALLCPASLRQRCNIDGAQPGAVLVERGRVCHRFPVGGSRYQCSSRVQLDEQLACRFQIRPPAMLTGRSNAGVTARRSAAGTGSCGATQRS